MGKGSKYAVFSYEIVEYVCMIFSTRLLMLLFSSARQRSPHGAYEGTYQPAAPLLLYIPLKADEGLALGLQDYS